jgi:hypothetical protein
MWFLKEMVIQFSILQDIFELKINTPKKLFKYHFRWKINYKCKDFGKILWDTLYNLLWLFKYSFLHENCKAYLFGFLSDVFLIEISHIDVQRTKGKHIILKEEIRDITRKRDTSHVAF